MHHSDTDAPLSPEAVYSASAALFLDLVTAHNSDHVYLEDFHLHTRVFGVVGIADCEGIADEAGQRKHLVECGIAFAELGKRYPSALVHRCLAFNTSKEMLANPVKGIDVIPSDGPISFHLASFMNSFASELLRSFSLMVKQIETRPLVLGPTAPNYNASSNRSGSTSNLNAQDTITVAGATAGGNSSERNKKRTPSRALKLVSDLYLLSGRLDIALTGYQSCMEGMKVNGDYMWWAAALESYQAAILLHLMNLAGIGPIQSSPSSPISTTAPAGTVLLRAPTTTTILASPALLTYTPLRTFLAETPDRHRQIMHLYEKANAAAATVGGSIIPILPAAVCIRIARVLRGMMRHKFAEYLVGGAGLSLVSTTTIGDDGSSTAKEKPGDAKSAQTTATTAATAAAAAGDKIVLNNGIGVNKLDISTWLMKSNYILSGQMEYVSAADRCWAMANIAAVFGSIGFRRKHAFFLREMGLAVSETLRPAAFSGVVAHAKTGDVRRTLDEWKKESMIQLEEGEVYGFVADPAVVPEGQQSPPIALIQCYKRIVQVHGIQIRSLKTPHVASTNFLDPTFSDDEEEWLDEYEKPENVTAALSKMGPTSPNPSRPNLLINSANPHVRTTSLRNLAAMAVALSKGGVKERGGTRQRYGWPALQIQVLKECVAVSEAVDDYAYTIYFIARLLRRLKKHLSPADQQDLADRLEAVMLKTQAARASSAQPPVSLQRELEEASNNETEAETLPVLVRGVVGGVAGIPVLRSLDVVAQPQRLIPLMHPTSWLVSSRLSKDVPKQLFLYNPTADKSTKKKVTLVANEPLYVDVVLANPFSFELDVKNVVLCTSGVAFKPVSMSTVIPPFSREHSIRVFGTPIESGTLHIHGCKVKLFGGFLEEEIYPLQKVLDDPSRKGKDGKRRRQDERERFGKNGVHFLNGKKFLSSAEGDSTSIGPDRSWSIPLDVVPSLPLLNVVKGARVALGALMLFEGEQSWFTLELENIGTSPINYLRVSFVENVASQEALASDTIEDFETVYERDIYEYNVRAFWLETQENQQRGRTACKFGPPKSMETINVLLDAGDRTTVKIGVFGKRMCTGGTIVFEYGNVVYPSDTPDGVTAPDSFCARQVLVPILLSVERALDIHNISVFHINNRDTAAEIGQTDVLRAMSLDDIMVDSLSMVGSGRDSIVAGGFKSGQRLNNQYFILSFDLQNLWNLPFEVSFDIYDDDETGSKTVSTISAHLYPGTTKRVILPVKRIYLPDTLTLLPIPVPTWKQFVVGRSQKLSYREDKFRRLAFWLREALVGLGVGGAPTFNPETGDYTSDLVQGGPAEAPGSFGRIVARWTCGRGRVGSLLGMRDFRLVNSDMADVVIQEEVSFSATAVVWEGVPAHQENGGNLVGLCGKLSNLSINSHLGRVKVKNQEFTSFAWTIVNNGCKLLLYQVYRVSL
ncbi:transport protein Trs120 or TRAPPC9 TRAPP II complex subunit-domain-containing protein [Chytriomyces sp. MP71]|nr:transport protein Trs120 or TRAPPC9 TRAPP II complex subunit-domain-containing protein [Chytriomyces sp. MP71]